MTLVIFTYSFHVTKIKWWDIDSLNLLVYVYVSCFLCFAVLIVPCSLFITSLERVDFLTLLCVVFSNLFVTFQYGVLGQVWFLIVSIPDLCLPLYFNVLEKFSYVIKILCYHIWRTVLVVFNDSIKLLSSFKYFAKPEGILDNFSKNAFYQ